MHIQKHITCITEKLMPTLHDKIVCNQYAWWLLEHLTQKTKTDLIIQSQIELDEHQEKLLQTWINQIVNEHKPIAYILGNVPFGDLTINVKPPVLIPRPETEQWIIDLIEQIKKSNAQKLQILDLCTGSGCIALLLAHELPDAIVYALDIADEAIALAQQNASLHNIKNLHIITSDLFEQLPNITFDIIVTNPPYIGTSEKLDTSVIAWEDKRALFADDNGIALIQKIIEQAPVYIHENEILQQQNIGQLYIEIGWQQGQDVKKLMQKNQYTAITIEKDSASKDRVVSGRINNVAIAGNKK
ncbi:MAG: peptide chain release factor N(5)-glutamine methyltransferase [Candidatus Dependentiae bacterium]